MYDYFSWRCVQLRVLYQTVLTGRKTCMGNNKKKKKVAHLPPLLKTFSPLFITMKGMGFVASCVIYTYFRLILQNFVHHMSVIYLKVITELQKKN